MEPSAGGFLLFTALLILGYFLSAPIIVGLLGSLPFGSTALVTLSGLGGSSPLLYAGFTLLLLSSVFLRRHFLDDLAIVLSRDSTAWIIAALAIYVVFSAVMFPRLFEGQTSAFVVVPFGGVRELPLAPVSGNIAQTAYFTVGALTYFAFAVLLPCDNTLQAVRRGFLAFAVLNAALGLTDLFGKLLQAGDILSPIRSASYALLVDEEAVGFWRIAGGYSEASAFAAGALTCLAFCFTYWRASGSPLACVLTFLLLFLLIFSTSSTAYVGIAVLAAFPATSIAISLSRRRATMQDFVLLLLVWVALIVILVVLLVREDFFQPFVRLFDTMVLNKMSSDSGEERSYWNAQSFQAFLDTGGVGIGMGSSRSSSWVISVLSQLGVIGSLMTFSLVGLLLWDLLAPRRGDLSRGTLAVTASVRAAGLASLVGPTIAGSGADPGVLFFVALAIVTTYRRRACQTKQYATQLS